ncbi:MAG: inorganic phosphate transporter [Chloroflexi bacterium]|nr:MAG: inorganic phosphate transporter [Chloroflexota bacterium]TMF73391.1 MAG: inorganic phosphate transporter [Chloroflexota bacterium]TMF79259.1 MAG: inorganic phosphate transporter [Chloroflexota bacterium]TMF91575.1 MAG: inorganic phosphate transporter [Chloroflexota bacterium]TMG46394.1 MAG: inorganic phosphate transporter [Chloroflexota bacterium]
MREAAILLWLTIGVAVLFDFTNGFHDTANAIATSISTRALSPRAAVGLSAVFNLVGAVVTVAFFQAKVSNTIASTLAIKPGLVVVMSALLGAISWNLITWYRGLPSSSTHALIGGLCGSGIAAAGGLGGVKWSSLGKQVASLAISPPLGFFAAAIFAVLLIFIVYRLRFRPAPVNRAFRGLQVLTAAFLSYSHGANDAQKTMAAITLALIAAGDLTTFQVPLWVVVLSAATIAFGTYAGGWRIIRTLGWSIIKLEPVTGLAAQFTGATVIQAATLVGLPVSTTHVVTGSVMGVGAIRKLSAVSWGLGANIALAWLVTIPAAAIIAWVVYAILHTAGLRG